MRLRVKAPPFGLALGLAFLGAGLEAVGMIPWLTLTAHPFPCPPFCRLRCAFFGEAQEPFVGLWLFVWMAAGAGFIVAIVWAGWRALVTLRRTNRALRALRAYPATLEWPWGDLRVFEDSPCPMAFTAGFLRPKVYASKALIESAHPKELRLILAHELHHVKKKDPLKVWILSFLTLSLPWCPLFSWLKERFLEEAEIQADDAALKAVNDPGLLAKTLLRLSAQGADLVAAFFSHSSQNSILATRVMRLAGLPKASQKKRPPSVVLWPSFLFYGFLGLSFAVAYAWGLERGSWLLGCTCHTFLS